MIIMYPYYIIRFYGFYSCITKSFIYIPVMSPIVGIIDGIRSKIVKKWPDGFIANPW